MRRDDPNICVTFRSTKVLYIECPLIGVMPLKIDISRRGDSTQR